MKLGVISDTHIHDLKQGAELAEYLLSGPFSQAEAILHAGDQVSPELESCFWPLPWFAVKGNMDGPEISAPYTRILELAGVRIGMMHGFGAAQSVKARVCAEFVRESIDVLVFGHSHQPVCCDQGSLLLLNPGSPTDRRAAPSHTVALLTLQPEIHAEIITVK